MAARCAIMSSNYPDKDAFVRELAPNSNYGGAGALSVSGTNPVSGSPTNGPFDSFMSFNTARMVSNFNAKLGTNNWTITGAYLDLTANLNPGNSLFNSGNGHFQIRWIANDTWVEGTGNPNTPTTDGITYSQEPDYLNTNTDVNLGSYDYTGSAKLTCALPLETSFVTNMLGGGEVGFFLTAVDPSLGCVLYSRNFAGNTNSLPALVVYATSQPVITSIIVSGQNLVISATNGVAGGVNYLLTSTNLNLPASQWTPIETNALSSGGSFMVTVTNAVPGGGPAQFYLLEAR